MKKGKLLNFNPRGMDLFFQKFCHVNMLYKRATNYGMESYGSLINTYQISTFYSNRRISGRDQRLPAN